VDLVLIARPAALVASAAEIRGAVERELGRVLR
jgi:hypothetical protein